MERYGHAHEVKPLTRRPQAGLQKQLIQPKHELLLKGIRQFCKPVHSDAPSFEDGSPSQMERPRFRRSRAIATR